MRVVEVAKAAGKKRNEDEAVMDLAASGVVGF
jgi:hypothetical protein